MARAPFGKPLIHPDKVVPPAERDGYHFGLRSGLSRTKFMDELLYANYLRQKSDKELRVELKAEFPNVPHDLQSIVAYRGYFNRNEAYMGIGRRLSGEERLPAFRITRSRSGKAKQRPALLLSAAQKHRATDRRARGLATKVSTQDFRFARASAIEGMLQEVKSFRRKRDRRLRDQKLENCDGKCEACGIDYSEVLNGLGFGVLMVHHDRRQLGAYRKDGELTNERDLAVVCANCHMLLHVNQTTAMKVAELRRKLRMS